MRLARTVDLTGVGAAQSPTLEFALSYDVEEGYDNVIVEAHPVGTDDWTTLPEAGGLTDTTRRRSARSDSCWTCTRSSGTT